MSQLFSQKTSKIFFFGFPYGGSDISQLSSSSLTSFLYISLFYLTFGVWLGVFSVKIIFVLP